MERHIKRVSETAGRRLALEDYVKDVADEVAAAYYDAWADDHDHLEGRFEREAGRIFGGYLLTLSDGYDRVRYVAEWEGAASRASWGTLMGAKVTLAGCTVDFLFKVCGEGSHRLLAVNLEESDERSGERSATEKRLIAAGCRVLTFADREVLEAPAKCAEEVTATLSELVARLILDAAAPPALGKPSAEIIFLRQPRPPGKPI